VNIMPATDDDFRRSALRPARRRGFFSRAMGWIFGTTRFLIATTLFFILMALLAYFVVGAYIRGAEVQAPSVIARSLSDAMQTAAGAKLYLLLDRREPHDTVPAGDIISQLPPPGSSVKTGTPLRVVVSTGSPLISVPDLKGESRVMAGVRLRNLGLVVGNVTEILVRGVAGGIVQDSDPPAGSGVNPDAGGGPVNLLVSSGRAETARTMPDLRGMSIVDARVVLAGIGLRQPEERRLPADGVPAGQIHRQEPPPGATVSPATPIVVTYTPPLVDPDSGFLDPTTPTRTLRGQDFSGGR
jgi:serine/threonine-protein kinase